MASLGAVILAAGVSSRMGDFKPMLHVDGETMIQRVVRMMRGAGADPVAVVTGYRREQLEEHLRGSGVLFVQNGRYWETQMLDSLLLGLRAVAGRCDKVLVSPADVPLVQPETVRALLGMDGQFVRPMYRGAPGHPVVLQAELLPVLESYTGEGGLRGAVESLGVELLELAVDDRGVVLDSDTKEDYTELLKYQTQRTRRGRELQLELRIGLRAESVFWGPETAQFLELVEATGSMQNACVCMHMAYSKGWKMVGEMERQLGYKVLVRVSGGMDGGGSRLTDRGKRLLDAYHAMQDDIRRQAQEAFDRYFHSGRIDRE